MKVTNEYLEDLIKRNAIPLNEWQTKYIGDDYCLIIKNPVYCRVFWLDYWYHVLSPKFKHQDMITEISNQDLEAVVIITESGNFLKVPQDIQNIDYFSKERPTTTKFKIGMSSSTILIIAFITFLCIIGGTLMFGKDSTYSTLV
ncbi:PIF-6 [Penaeus vannamei nudivirus]|nr:PIF-6 [Penaeus vannamei nucleopolyhedrovirus]